MYLRKISSAVAMAAALTFLIPVSALSVSASSVTLNFMCPCGTCDEALSTCECPESNGFRSQIAGMVGRGYSEEQVIQDFRGRFGPDVLIANAGMAPDPTGFDFSRKTIGIIFLLASFSLVAFSLGRYMSPAPSRAPARQRSASGQKSRSSTKQDRWRAEEHGGGEEKRFLEDHEI